jgi:Flp pilus assembly protein TadG
MLTRSRLPLARLAARLARDDRGQTAWGFALAMLLVFMVFAVSFDVGIWVFDHRTAQNQAEAAALAAVQELPASDTTAAEGAAKDYLARNGVDWATEGCASGWIAFSDENDNGELDRVRVCLERSSGVVFAALSDITNVDVSASATALVGRANVAQVMPWAVVPPDPDCSPDEVCSGDNNGDGDYLDDGDCQGDFDDCPWGLNPDNLLQFKSGGGGNTGIIDACGNGANGYKDCISGDSASGFFEEGTTVVVGLQGGNLGANTNNALNDRYPEDAAANYICDVPADPEVETGYDPDGRADAFATFDTDVPAEFCRERLVLVPIIASMPPQGGGSEELVVLGVATFGIAAWNHDNNQDAFGNPGSACSTSNPDTGFDCGMVWGYLMQDLRPPDFLLQEISGSENPFAPLLIALVE